MARYVVLPKAGVIQT